MEWILGFYGISFLVLFIIAIASWFIWDRRFKSEEGKTIPKGFERTNEVSIDPSTNKRQVVYFNPQTGERFYKEENDK